MGCPGKNASGLDAWGLQEEDPGQFVSGRRSLLKRHWGILVVTEKLEGREAGTLSMWCGEKWDLDRMAEPTGNDGLEAKGKAEAKENYRSTAGRREISSDLPWQKESSGWNVRNGLENTEEAATAKWPRSCVSSWSLWLSTCGHLKRTCEKGFLENNSFAHCLVSVLLMTVMAWFYSYHHAKCTTIKIYHPDKTCYVSRDHTYLCPLFCPLSSSGSQLPGIFSQPVLGRTFLFGYQYINTQLIRFLS